MKKIYISRSTGEVKNSLVEVVLQIFESLFKFKLIDVRWTKVFVYSDQGRARPFSLTQAMLGKLLLSIDKLIDKYIIEIVKKRKEINMEIQIIISDHAYRRWRERQNLTYKISISKLARQGYIKGRTINTYSGAFANYLHILLSKTADPTKTIRVYKNFILIFSEHKETATLVTIWEIPDSFFMEKNYSYQKVATF